MNTFWSPVQHAARIYRDRLAMLDVATGMQTTFGELALRVEQVTALLDRLGIPLGGRVAILAEGSQRYAWLYLGIPSAGRVVAPLNGRYTTSELTAACRDCQATVLFTDRPSDPELKGLAELVLPLDERLDGLLDAAPPARRPAIHEDEPAAIFYTGGTTDRAKGVSLSHRNKLADAQTLIIELDLDKDDRWLVMSPMFHAAGSFNILPCVWRGAAQVFLPRFEATSVLTAIEEQGITITFGVPTMLNALADAQTRERRDVSSLRLIGHGGAPATRATLRRTALTFPTSEICVQYGATEMAPLATVGRHQELLIDTPADRSVGTAALGVDVSIHDSKGQDVPTGETGEIVVTGANIMLGYWGKPELTAEVLEGNSYRSGDVGFLGPDGELYVVDRLKDMIISGGENVYSAEVEDALALHPDVVEAAVVGVPDDRWGELVTAIVVTRHPVDEAELDRHCRELLAAYKVPRAFSFRTDPLPRTAAGKLIKRELRTYS